MSHDSPATPNDVARPPRRYRFLMPFPVWVVLLAAGAVTFLQSGQATDDPGLANTISLSLVGAAGLLLILWFVFFSGFSRQERMAGLVALLIAGGVTASLVQIQGFTGAMALRFAWRFASRPSDLLPSAAPASKAVDLATTTPLDFPQFLGPQRDGLVHGVRLATDWEKQPPELLWKQPIGAGWAGVAIVNGLAVTMEQRGAQEWVSCYDVKTGQLQWASTVEARHQHIPGGVGPRSTPTIHQGLVLAQGATGILRCLEGSTGKTLWEHDLVKEFGSTAAEETAGLHWGRSGSPLVVGDKVIVAAGGPKSGKLTTLVAYHVRTGQKIWEGGERFLSYSSPTLARIDGVEQVLIVSEDWLSSHDAASGKVLWEISWPGNSSRDANVSNAIQVGADQVFISKGYGQGALLLRVSRGTDGTWTTHEIWRLPRVLRTKFSNVVLKDGYVYGLSDGMLECAELATGKKKWKDGRYGYGQNLRVGDHLVILSEEGEVVLVELSPDRPNNVLGRIQAIEGTTWNPFALSGPHLIVRNAQEIACYRLPLAKD